jgi:hypothetical protein
VWAVLVAVAVAGCAKAEPFRPLAAGQCLPESADVVGTREQQPPVVPCTEPHRYEVYATPTLDDLDAWPGQAAADEASKQLCYQRFESGTGHDPLTLPDGVDVLTIGPSESGFTGSQDRRVECLVVLPSDRTGSFIDPATPPRT